MTTSITTDCAIRWMIRRDMPEVLQIEQACFKLPWSEEDFIVLLKQRNCIGMVIEVKEQIIGFMLYQLHKDYLQILDFAVSPSHQREGIGSQLIGNLKAKLSQQRRTRIIEEVRESNLPMQLFLRSHGFRATKVISDAFDDCDEDAYRMEYDVLEDE